MGNEKAVYLDWQDPVSGHVILVGVYDKLKDAAQALGVREDHLADSIRNRRRARSGVEAHYGRPPRTRPGSVVLVDYG